MYSNLSKVYDIFINDYDYENIIKKIEPIFKKNNVKNILDLACGTGNMTMRLYSLGYNVSGVDISEKMLAIAKEKASRKNYKIPFFHQDIRDFDVNKKFDVIVSFTDGYNYLVSEKDIKKSFERVCNSLNDNGIFIFDMSSIYKFENIIGNKTFAENDENASYIWENYYDEDKHILEFDITLFIKKENSELFEKTVESHIQRGYKVDDVKKMLIDSKFEIENIFGSNENIKIADRIFYVVRRKTKWEKSP